MESRKMVNCKSCNKNLNQFKKDGASVSISGSIMGDEYTETWYYCEDCRVYTVEVYHDRFSGEEHIFYRGPIPEVEGEEQVQLIGHCARPWDKKCRCSAHRAYFGDSLD